MVRNRGVGARGHDGLERHPVGAVVQHQRLQLAAHLALGAAGPQATAVDQIGQRGVGRLAGQPQQRDLAGVLDLAQRLDRARRADQLGVAGLLGERVEPFDGDDVTLEARAVAPRRRGASGQERSAGPFDHDLGVRGLLRRLRAVAPVGGQHRSVVVRANQQRRVRTGETGQITHVDQARYQHRVQSVRPQPLPQPVSTLGYSHRS